MNKKRNFLIAVVTVVALAIALVIAVPKLKKVEEATVTIFHTNDMHANLIGDVAEGKANLAVISAIVDEVPGALLVDAGDALQGQPYCMLSEGLDVIRLMNAAGYDAMAVGNHEFDFGLEAMHTNFTAAEFPVLAANLTFEGEAAALAECIGSYTVLQQNGKNIAVIGLAGLDTLSTVAPDSRAGIAFGDYIPAIENAQKELKTWARKNHQKIDYTVILSHLGDAMEDPENPYWSTTLATQLTDIDLIIDGHAHSYLINDRVLEVNGVKIVSAGGQLSSLGRLDIHFNADGSVDVVSTDAMPYTVNEQTPQNADVLAVIKEVRKAEEALDEVVIGTAADHIEKSIVDGLVADALLWQTKQDVHDSDALLLGYICVGNVRAEIEAGDITMGDAFSVLPWGSEMKYIEINPNILYQMVETGLRLANIEENGQLNYGHGSYLFGAGFSYEADLSQPATVVDDEAGAVVSMGQRVVSITLDDGTVLDRNDTTTRIIMPSGDYNINGGDGYWCLVGNCKVLDIAGISQEQALAQYIDYLAQQPGFENGLRADLIKTERFTVVG